jgi:vacuolar protein sorting-associated protein 35
MPEDLDGVLDSCHVLIKDQTDASAVGGGSVKDVKEIGRQGPYAVEKEDTAE